MVRQRYIVRAMVQRTSTSKPTTHNHEVMAHSAEDARHIMISACKLVDWELCACTAEPFIVQPVNRHILKSNRYQQENSRG